MSLAHLLAGCTGTLSIIEPPGRDAETAFDSSVDAAVRDGGVDSTVAMDALRSGDHRAYVAWVSSMMARPA